MRKMMTSFLHYIGGVSVVVFSVMTAASAGEPISVDAFSVWQASGKIFRTGEQQGTFVGVLQGPLYIETERGPVGAGDIACPFMVTIDLETGHQEGSGDCTFTAKDGPLAFAKATCQGFHLIGCKGDFVFAGGTGRFEGVSGGGPITIRNDKWEISVDAVTEVSQAAIGIAFWRDLTYRLP